jgi:hypothetical protein
VWDLHWWERCCHLDKLEVCHRPQDDWYLATAWSRICTETAGAKHDPKPCDGLGRYRKVFDCLGSTAVEVLVKHLVKGMIASKHPTIEHFRLTRLGRVALIRWIWLINAILSDSVSQSETQFVGELISLNVEMLNLIVDRANAIVDSSCFVHS